MNKSRTLDVIVVTVYKVLYFPYFPRDMIKISIIVGSHCGDMESTRCGRAIQVLSNKLLNVDTDEAP